MLRQAAKFPFIEDGLVLHARFSDLVDLYEIEFEKPEKRAYKLNKKMPNPSIEKSSVQLADICFYDGTIFTLRYYWRNGYPCVEETADFLQIIRDWYNLVHCKTREERREEMQSTLTTDNCSIFKNFTIGCRDGAH